MWACLGATQIGILAGCLTAGLVFVLAATRLGAYLVAVYRDFLVGETRWP